MIHAVLIINNQCKPRLIRFYRKLHEEAQQTAVRDAFRAVHRRSMQDSNFVKPSYVHGLEDCLLVYKQFSTLYFILFADDNENELSMLDLVQVLVDAMDTVFSGVCELDLIFHVHKAHYILAECIAGGLVNETSCPELQYHSKRQSDLKKLSQRIDQEAVKDAYLS